MALGVFLAGGALAWGLASRARESGWVGAGAAIAGSALGLVAAGGVLSGGPVQAFRVPWNFPLGTFYVEIDGLSAFFLVVLFVVTAVTAAFGVRYLEQETLPRRAGASWLYFNALAASMALVVVARNGILFLIGWEAMALSSFFLVMFHGDQESVREAGWKYLVATHLGTGLVLSFFAVLAGQAGTLDFDALRALGPLGGAWPSVLLLLAVGGFGTKAGFIPLHVWLPEAHPAAPSHVSALMSGAMIKMGIYGLMRGLTFLGPPALWWGWLLVLIGLSSGVLGILFSLAQRDLKRLLAYSSVENIGIIALGLGVALLGAASGRSDVAFLGYAGALLHVLNHALFKALLFLGAGSVSHGAHTRKLEALGGLMKRMPWTGLTFLVGSAAIAGLPPLNGFLGEFLIYSGAIAGTTSMGPDVAIALAAAVAGLAIIGALAAAGFARAFGMVFLGAARTEQAAQARESPTSMVLPLLVLAGLCIGIGLAPPVMLGILEPAVVSASTTLSVADVAAAGAAVQATMVSVAWAAALLVGAAIFLAAVRNGLLSKRQVAAGPTWDCGYAQPSARMQYTASSFAAPLTGYFRKYLRTHRRVVEPEGFFPKDASLRTATPDPWEERLFAPVFLGVRRLLRGVLPIQSGRVQAYVFYISATLLALLLWGLV